MVAFNSGFDNWKQMGVQQYFGQDETIAGRAVGEQAVAHAAPSFNPVGDLMAGAQSALAPVIGEVSVPRIAIHVFGERQDTLAAAERAGQDRRLSRATTQIRVGGAPARLRTGPGAVPRSPGTRP